MSPPGAPASLMLADLIRGAGSGDDVKEEPHMQPTVMKVLQAARQAVGKGPILKDTHSRTAGLKQPDAQPGACSLHSPLTAWAQVVVLWEFKVSSKLHDANTMLGQQITRSRHVLDSQPKRKFVVAVSLTMESVELLLVERKALNSVTVFTSGPEWLSFCPESAGFALLVRLLATPEAALGFKELKCSVKELGPYSISEAQLLCYGTAPQGHGSLVYQVTASSTESHCEAVLKLHDSDTEVNLCAMLRVVMGYACCVAR